MSQMGTPKIRLDKNLARMIGNLRDTKEKARMDAASGLGALGTPEIRRGVRLRAAIKNANDRAHWAAGRLDMVGHKFLMAKCLDEKEGRAWKELRRRERATKW